MKKALKIVGVIFILLIAAIVILPIIFKDDIIQLVKEQDLKWIERRGV